MGYLAAKRLGASRIIVLGHHKDRLQLARSFGATDLIDSKGEQAEGEVKEMTQGGATPGNGMRWRKVFDGYSDRGSRSPVQVAR